MIVDAVLYNGEEDIFDLRYNLLKDKVDEFIVVEFGKTFSGKDKEAHPINLPKVSYHFFTQVKDLKPDLPPAFAMEYNQREMIKDCLRHLKDNDTIVMGDVDEIWSSLDGYKLPPLKLRLRVYSYYLNNRSSEYFTLGPVVFSRSILDLYTLNELRSNSELAPLSDKYWGWHFTSMGGVERLKKKIESYGHQEFNLPQIKDNLEDVLKNRKDYIGRDFTYKIDESELPEYLKENKEKYKHLFYEPHQA